MLFSRNQSSRSFSLTHLATALALMPSSVGLSGEVVSKERSQPTEAAGSTSLPAVRNTWRTLASGVAIQEGAGRARYELDSEHRIRSIEFPNGLKVEDITYLDLSSGRAAQVGLTVVENSITTRYERGRYKDIVFNSWNVSIVGAKDRVASPLNYSIMVSRFGELAVIDGNVAFQRLDFPWEVTTARGTKMSGRLLPGGAFMYADLDDTTKIRLIRRSDLTEVHFDYNNGRLSEIREEGARGDVRRRWRSSPRDGMWICDDESVLPSEESPILMKTGAQIVKYVDGSSEIVAATGARSVWGEDSTERVYFADGRLESVRRGLVFRHFSYDERGCLVSFLDSKCGATKERVLTVEDGFTLRARSDSGIERVPSDGNVKALSQQKQPPLSGLLQEEGPFEEWPPFPQHVHDISAKQPTAMCNNHICPPMPPREGVPGILGLPTIRPGAQRLLSPRAVTTWSSLDIIAQQRDGLTQSLVSFLKIWAETTTDEDITRVCSMDRLRDLRASNGSGWIHEELVNYGNADFLVWLRRSVKEGKLPCTLDVKPLNIGFNGKKLGGITGVVLSPDSNSLSIHVDIQASDFTRSLLEKGYSKMITGGGLELCDFRADQPRHPWVDLIHELHHVFHHSCSEIFWEEQEPPAHLASFQVMATITKEKAKRYRAAVDVLR